MSGGLGGIPKFLGAALPFGAIGMAMNLFKKPKVASPPPAISRNDAAARSRLDDEFRRRRGAGANELTGGGAEASTGGGKTLLGQ